jgi:hypothetical protein
MPSDDIDPPQRAESIEVLDDYCLRIHVVDGAPFEYDASELVEEHPHLASHFSKIRLIEDGRMVQWSQPDRETSAISKTVSRMWREMYAPDTIPQPRPHGAPPRREHENNPAPHLEIVEEDDDET